MKNISQIKTILAIASLGLVEDEQKLILNNTPSFNDIRLKINTIQKYVAQNSLKIALKSNLNELIIKTEDCNICWKKMVFHDYFTQTTMS